MMFEAADPLGWSTEPDAGAGHGRLIRQAMRIADELEDAAGIVARSLSHVSPAPPTTAAAGRTPPLEPRQFDPLVEHGPGLAAMLEFAKESVSKRKRRRE